MTRAPGRFGAVITAMVTPFGDDGSLDVDGAAQLARWLADNGSDGLVVAGSTGEGSLLSDGEKRDLWSAVAGAVTIPVIAATGSAATDHTIEQGRIAEECGVDGLLVVTPYYVRPSQAGLVSHFSAVAAATRLPILLYDIPVRSGRKIAVASLVRLASEFPNIIGVKDAGGDVAATALAVARCPEGFEVYCGDDVLTLPMLSVGAVGLISVASHWAGVEIGEMIASFFKGDVRAAAQANATLIPSWEFETGEEAPNPVPAKTMMRVLGQPAGPCRLPLGEPPAGLDGLACEVLAGLGRLPDSGVSPS